MTIKTSLPLPNNEKELAWTRELQVRLGRPFHAAKYWKVSFCESDIKYIENVIKTSNLYRTVYKQGQKATNRTIRGRVEEIEFLERFMNDEKCPNNVKNFLYLHIGNVRNSVRPKVSAADYLVAEKWHVIKI